MGASREDLLARYDFPLDDFQLQAIDALDAGAVGAGGGARPARARRWWPSTPSPGPWPSGQRAFYTTPIKALSNQKFLDLTPHPRAPTPSGLLTGDNAINGDAPVVVMTTEVLRNMIYGRSRRAARPRRAWCSTRSTSCRTPTAGRCGRRSSSTCPHRVRLVCLSATVSNADELADWMTTVRGPTAAIVEQQAAGARWRTSTWSATARPSACTCCPPWSTAGPTPRPAASTARRCGAGGAAAASGAGGGSTRPGGWRWSSASTTRRCCRRSTSSSAGPRATTPPRPCSTPACGSRPATSATGSARSSTAASAASTTATSPCSATAASWPGSRPASPPTTPAWCRRSRRWWRRASPPAW